MIELDGEPATAHKLAEALSRLIYMPADERGLDLCHACLGDGRDDEGAQCSEKEPGVIADVDWNICPFGLLTTPWWRAMSRLDHARRVSPLAGWPDAYSAGAVTAILALDGAAKERERIEHKRAMRRAQRG